MDARRILRTTISAVVIAAAVAVSQGPAFAASTWARAYGTTGNDEARSIRQTSDGGFIVAGRTPDGFGSNDALVIKLDNGGNVQWQRTYGGTGNDEAEGIVEVSSGGYAMAGRTTSYGSGGDDIWVVRLNASGGLVWQNAYGGPVSNELGYSIIELAGGGFGIAGDTDDATVVSGGEDFLFLAVDGSGNLLWQQVYGNMGTLMDFGRSIAQTDDNADGTRDDGFIVAGYAIPSSGGSVDNDFRIVKTDAVGNAMWDKSYDGTFVFGSGETAFSVDQTSDGGYIVAGANPSNLFDFWILKLDGAGLQQWSFTHGSAAADSAYAVWEKSGGGYMAAGYGSVNGTDFYLMDIDGSGNLQWAKTYGGLGSEEAYDAVQTADGGVVMAGYTTSFGAGGRDVWVVKVDALGDLVSSCGLATTTTFMLSSSPPTGTGGPTMFNMPMFNANGSTAAAVTPSLGTNSQCSGTTGGGPTRVSQALGGAHEQECAVSIDPSNVNRQVVAYIDRPSPPGAILAPSLGVSFTTDGGVTWADRQIQHTCDGVDNDVPPDGLIDEELCNGLDDDFDTFIDEDLCCQLEHIDPAVATDTSGNNYSVMVTYEPNAPTSFQGSSYVVAGKSTDGGNTWTQFPPVDQSVWNGAGFADFLDKSWITADNQPGSGFGGTVYATWQRDDSSPGNILNSNVYLAPLAPGGTTFGTPVQVNDLPNSCAGSAYPVVDISGQVWVIWRRNANPTLCGQPGQFFVDVSGNGGLTFGLDNPGLTYTQIPRPLYAHTISTPDFPFLAVDPTNPMNLYVVYADNPAGTDEADIMFTKSFTGGLTWFPPVRVNDDVTIQPQFFPVVRTKMNSNAWTLIDVIWYDERNTFGCDRIDNDGDFTTDEELADGIDNDADGTIDEDLCDVRIDVYFSRSVDAPAGTSTFTPSTRVTTSSFRLPGNPPNFLGDYIDLGTAGANDYAVWAGTSNGDNDIFAAIIGDIDSDGDGALDMPDCNPSDPGVIAGPVVVQNVQTAPSGANAQISWTSQDAVAGFDTSYDIVTGLISELRADGGYPRATCLVDDDPDTPYLDTRTAPPAGDAYYYLMRADNTCGVATFGTTGPSDPRAALDNNTVCNF